MANGKINALIIFSLVIGASGLATGIFSIINYQIVEGPQGPPGIDGEDGLDGVDGVNGTLNNIVGIWETVYGGPDTDYYLNFSDNKVYDTDYINDFNNRTIYLLKEGWYRVYIRLVWIDLTTEVFYLMTIQKNGGTDHVIEYVYNLTSFAYKVETSTYVYNDGNDFFLVRAYSNFDADSFGVTTNQVYNQFVIEYVKEP